MSSRLERERALRYYRFLQEYALVRFPYLRDLENVRWSLWLEELPQHPSIRVNRLLDEGQEEDPGVYLRVRRPKLSAPPEPPALLREWLEPGWEDPFSEPRLRSERSLPDADGQSRVVRFEEVRGGKEAWASWLEEREVWARDEGIARRAHDVYEKIYGLYGDLQRESERYELVLADGILSWSGCWGSLYVPLLLVPVQLEFNPKEPEFIVRDAGKEPQLYTAPLRDVPLANPSVLASIQEELASGQLRVHPLGEGDTSGFLRRLVQSLSPDGEYIGKGKPDRGSRKSQVGRYPVLFIRERMQGYSRAIELLLEGLQEEGVELSGHIKAILGIPTGEGARSGVGGLSAGTSREKGDLGDILFTKPWNHEQERIVERLERYGSVVVQGPPGTGKTHTIANLIGHLLAQGKSVLVTAYSSKALAVLREKIVDSLRPLAVSVLNNDLESRAQLEEAVQAITTYLSEHNPEDLHRQADRLAEKRQRLKGEIERLRRDILDCIQIEYRSIVMFGREYSPSEAARIVREGKGTHDWIPPPVRSEAALTLSREELEELYRLNAELSPEDEQELDSLPDPKDIPGPERFREWITLEEKLNSLTPKAGSSGLCSQDAGVQPTPEELEALAEQARQTGRSLLEAEAWELALIGEEKEIARQYESLFEGAELLFRKAASEAAILIQYRPELARDIPLEEQAELAQQLVDLARNRGGRLRGWDVLFSPRRRRFIQAVRVAGKPPSTVSHFRALASKARLLLERENLSHLWDYLVARKGGPHSKDFGEEPERAIKGYAHRLRGWLSFRAEKLVPLIRRLEDLGFLCREARETVGASSPHTSPEEHWRPLGEYLAHRLPEILRARALEGRVRALEEEFSALLKRLDSSKATSISVELKSAILQKDPQAYETVYRRYTLLARKRVSLERRRELLSRLAQVAPGWADAIRRWEQPHRGPYLPGDPEAAWLWRQLHEELVRRSQLSIQDLQEALQAKEEQLHRVTAELVRHRAWAYRLEKTSEEQRQALIGWLNTIRRIGKGTGKHAPRLRVRAAHLLTKAKDAVPVWIMPLSRVVEQFDPRRTRFDVVIIDEASQCDPLALVALYMGRQVVVVGDHEQVSPEGVGQDLDRIAAFQEEYLKDIPNAHLYDGRRSVYDIARESFGGTIMLVEHFRCVPEIIQFSNQLCYQGRILPLRDSTQVPLKPHVVPYRVRGIARGKRNEEEAETIVALIQAMTRHPLYDGKTIGVISMVGEEQALWIDRLLRERMSAQELLQRRLLCGTPAQFQGDERDVVLLSLVDSPNPDGRPLPMRQDDRFKQRFNVAASRARDQLWVIYSLDPSLDLQEGDLRRRLIEYAFHHEEILAQALGEMGKTESPFEREVFLRLAQAGYRVRAQVSAGRYRIDLVVEGNGQRVAIECDGERWHPIERIEEDLERQAILERMGWRFIRIRGSEFFRDPEATMRRVFANLERMGITPGSAPHGPGDPPQPSAPLAEEVIRMAQEILQDRRSVWA